MARSRTGPAAKLTWVEMRLTPYERADSWRTSPEQLAGTTDCFRDCFESVAEPWFRAHNATLEGLLGAFEQFVHPLARPVLLIREHLGTAREWWDRYDAFMALPVVSAMDEYYRRSLEEIASGHTRPDP